jgi:hypothetical protein
LFFLLIFIGFFQKINIFLPLTTNCIVDEQHIHIKTIFYFLEFKLKMSALLTADNPVFACFSFYAALLCAKTLLMALLTARQRLAKKVYHHIYALKLMD